MAPLRSGQSQNHPTSSSASGTSGRPEADVFAFCLGSHEGGRPSRNEGPLLRFERRKRSGWTRRPRPRSPTSTRHRIGSSSGWHARPSLDPNLALSLTKAKLMGRTALTSSEFCVASNAANKSLFGLTYASAHPEQSSQNLFQLGFLGAEYAARYHSSSRFLG